MRIFGRQRESQVGLLKRTPGIPARSSKRRWRVSSVGVGSVACSSGETGALKNQVLLWHIHCRVRPSPLRFPQVYEKLVSSPLTLTLARRKCSSSQVSPRNEIPAHLRTVLCPPSQPTR